MSTPHTSPMAQVAQLLATDRRVLLLGQPGIGKSTLARRLAAALAGQSRACACIGADPGLPAFGVPGTVSLALWQDGDWRSLRYEALCTLDAGRFRLPLVSAVRRLARERSQGTLLLDAPGVVRGTPGEELLQGLIEAAGIDLVLVLVRDDHAPPLIEELRALSIEIVVVHADAAARRPGKPARARYRTALWDGYLEDAVERHLDVAALRIIGTPPPTTAPDAWVGRQVALLDADRTVALGEVLALDGECLQVRMPLSAQASTLLVRNACRSAAGVLESAVPFAAEPLISTVVTDTRNERTEPSSPAITGRVGDVNITLVNGVLGDSLLHLRLRHQRRSLLFDLGAGGRLPARVAHEVSDLFISHAHMDHIAGFLWLIRSRIGDLPACRVYGPPGIAQHIQGFVDAILWDRIGARGPRFEITEVHDARLLHYVLQVGSMPLTANGETVSADGVLLRESGFRVRAQTLDHGTPVLAFAFEPDRQLNVRKDRLLARGLMPGPWLGRLKAHLLAGETAARVELPDGRCETAGELGADLVLATPGKKLVYATDLADTPMNRARLAALARGAHTFLCECPFLEADAGQAARTGHLTTRACGEIANAAGVARLVPFHFSRRYLDEPAVVYAEVAAVCSRVVAPFELSTL